MKFTIAPLMAILVLVGVGCNVSNPGFLDGAAYVKYPKADIIVRGKEHRDHYLFVICDPTSTTRALRIMDNTIGTSSALVEEDTEIPGIPCGTKLQELQRLAEIGKQYEKK